MAHYVAYKDEESAKQHYEVKAHNKHAKGADRIKLPPLYAVKFMGVGEDDGSEAAGD